jgi:hypothetical protein
MDRRLLLPVALALVALTAGCMGFGPGDISAEQLDGPPAGEYDWEANATVHITVLDNATFTSVYELEGDQIKLYRNDGFGGQTPLSVEAVRYRYPNGTIIEGSDIESRGGAIDRNRKVVTVTLPPDTPAGGQLAFTAGSTPKRFSLPVYVEGSYEVVLPPNRAVEVPVFGTVRPRSTQTDRADGRLHLYWENVTARTIVVQFYLQRDLYVFGAIAAALVVVGVGGVVYYRRQIDRLRERREEMGLDVETDDDEFDRGPPPGMG